MLAIHALFITLNNIIQTFLELSEEDENDNENVISLEKIKNETLKPETIALDTGMFFLCIFVLNFILWKKCL